jgi:hypothetical protein
MRLVFVLLLLLLLLLLCVRRNDCLCYIYYHYLTYFYFLSTGYRRYFEGLAEFLGSQPFADRLSIEGHEDRTVTGNFEVSLGAEGKVIHSKRVAGQGKAQSLAERNAIAELIREYLGDMDEG